MLSPLASLGVAQTIFYAPIVPLAIYLAYRNWHKRPRMAWYPFVLLTLMRLAGGPVTIALAGDMSSEGLIIAATFLLNVGVIPLLVVNFGLVVMVMQYNVRDKDGIHRFGKQARIAFSLSVIFIIVGTATAAVMPSISRIFQLLGYSSFAFILLVLFGIQINFWRNRHNCSPSSRIILTGVLSAAPFLILRNIYGLLYYATNYYTVLDDGEYIYNMSMWNPILGSTVAFALMALVPEYIAICIYFRTGFTISREEDLPEISTQRDNHSRKQGNNLQLREQGLNGLNVVEDPIHQADRRHGRGQ